MPSPRCSARPAPSAWLDKPVPDALLEQLYEHVRLGPTAVNSRPARFVFVRSAEGKQKLAPCPSKGNLDKTPAAPVTVIVACDEDFPETLPELFPHADARSWYAGQPALITENALRNSSLQAGYLILAARALGLDWDRCPASTARRWTRPSSLARAGNPTC